MKLILCDDNGNTIKKCRLTDIPIKEEVVVANSLEIYNDPAPCIIRRSAISKVLYSKLMDELNVNYLSETKMFQINSLSKELQESLNFASGATGIILVKK